MNYPSKNGKANRVAIYARVSKGDGSQDEENQLLQLREFCERQKPRRNVWDA